MTEAERVVFDLLRWAEAKCPCENETPDPCPLCGASVDGLEGCKAADMTLPASLLHAARAVEANCLKRAKISELIEKAEKRVTPLADMQRAADHKTRTGDAFNALNEASTMAIRLALADLAQAVHPFKRWRLRLAIFFAERERAAALRAHQKAKHRLMAMVI